MSPGGSSDSRGLVVGLDAGGTKTVGLLADVHGDVRAKASGPGANLLVHGELSVEKVLFQIIEDLEPPASISALCLGIAGADLPGQNDLLRDMFRRLGLRQRVVIVHDAHIALVAGAPEGTGIVVVAGTGSIAYGVDHEGRTARSGGWGYLLGDEGSAYWLGHAAVRLGIRGVDGRGPATTLYGRVCEKLELDGAPGLVEWFYDPDLSRYRVAELAPLVEEAARDGDEAAEELLEHAAQHLSHAAGAVSRRLTLPASFPLVLAGGAFKACPSLLRRIGEHLELPNAAIRPLEVEPARGAVTLALGQLDS